MTEPKAVDNIVQFGKYHSIVKDPVHAEMRAYWEDLRAGRLMPLRSEVDPRELASLLEHCFILEQLENGEIKFRLAGRQINDLLGMEVRGMPLRALISPVDRPEFSATLAKMFETPEMQEYALLCEQPGELNVAAKMLILPLKSDDGQINRAIGCLTTEALVGTKPQRFRVEQLSRTSLLGTESETKPFRHTMAAESERAAAKASFDTLMSDLSRQPQTTEQGEQGMKMTVDGPSPQEAPWLRIIK